MAAPNIVGVTTITGITTSLALSNTTATVLVSNPPGSDYVYKINTIIVANKSASTANITASLHDRALGAGNAFRLSNAIDITTKATLVILDKASSIYLPENSSLTVAASAGNAFDVVCSYEAIVD